MFQDGTFTEAFYLINKDCIEIYMRLYDRYEKQLDTLKEEIIITVFSHYDLRDLRFIEGNIVRIYEEFDFISYLYKDE
jgi:hypothetical protein